MEVQRGYGGYQGGYNNQYNGQYGQYGQQGYQGINQQKSPDVYRVDHGGDPRFISNGSTNGQHEKLCLVFVCLSICVFLPLIIVGFVLVFSAISKVETGFTNSFGTISGSWKSDLIFGLTSNPNVALPEGQYVVPWGGVWPGTIEGCNCPNSVLILGRRNVWPGLQAHSCTYNETYSGCQRVSSQSQVQMNRWNGGEQFYAVKYAKTSFLDSYQQMDEQGKCATGYKLCGNPSSKSKGVCIKDIYTECPITRISQSPEAGLTPITLGSTTLYVGRDNSANPFSDVGVSEAFVCSTRSFYSNTPGRKRYALLRGNSESCMKDNDATYFGEIGERNLFQVNQVPYTNLPEYEVDDKYKYVQYADRPLEWAPSCKDIVPKTQKLGDDIKVVSDQASTLRTVAIIALIIAIVATMVQCCGLGIPTKIATGISLALTLIAVGLMIPYLSKAISKGNEFSGTFDSVKSRQCSNEIANKEFDAMGGSFKSDYTGTLNTAMWLIIAGCVLQALFSLFALVAKNDGDENQHLRGGSNW